jgi:PRC-barrel domain
VSDLGAPVSYLALPDGVPVFDRDGARVGVVDHILIDDVTGIFEGVIIHTRPVVPGRHLFASHEQIAELRERGVRLAVDRDDLYELGQPGPRGRLHDRAAESAVETALRKAWDWITGVR